MVFATIFILLIASHQQSQPNSGVKKGAVQETHSQKHSGSDDKHTPNPASDAVSNGCSVQTPTGQNQPQDAYDPRKDTLYRAYLGFTIVGVLLALLGIAFIYKQTGHIEAQTEYLRRQNVISQTTARQWVRFDGWRQHLHDDDRHLLEISFNVVNPTTIPLYLDTVVTKADTTTATIAIGTVLIPDHPYPLQILPFLGIEKLAHYQGGKLVLTVEVSALFRDSFENKWEQKFSGLFLCGRTQNYLFIQESRTTMHRSDPEESGKTQK